MGKGEELGHSWVGGNILDAIRVGWIVRVELLDWWLIAALHSKLDLFPSLITISMDVQRHL